MLEKLLLVLPTLLAIASPQTAVFAGAAPETAGQILARLSKLAPEQRQATLVEKAKVEGEVNFYSTLQAQQIEPFLQVFRKRYPFVKPVPTRVSGNRQLVRIQSEFNSGAHIVDVANGSPELAAGLRKLGIIDPYHSPQRDFYVAPSKDKDGYFTSFYVMPIVLGYNSQQVKRADAPKNYEELAAAEMERQYHARRRSPGMVRRHAQTFGPGKRPSVHARPGQTGFAHGARPNRAEPTARRR